MKQSTLAVACALLIATPSAYAQDAAAGKTVFTKCSACHAADKTTNKMGPHLGDLIGRKAGTVGGFTYSKAMKDAGEAGLVWDDAMLTEYLAAPRTKVPGTKMAFAGLKKPEEIRNVIAYIKTIGQ